MTTEAGALARLDQIITSRLKQEIAKHDFLQVIREQRESIMRAVTDDAKVLAREVWDRSPRCTHQALGSTPRGPGERLRPHGGGAPPDRAALPRRGEEAAREIRASADKEREIILATAYEQAERIRGEGDARAARIYAERTARIPTFTAS